MNKPIYAIIFFCFVVIACEDDKENNEESPLVQNTGGSELEGEEDSGSPTELDTGEGDEKEMKYTEDIKAVESSLVYDPNTHEVTVEIQTTPAGASFQNCTHFIRFYEADDSGAAPIGSTLFDDQADAWNGYFLDGKYVPPIAGMGCDVGACQELDGYKASFRLLNYERIGVRTLTEKENEEFAADYRKTAAGDNVPNELSDYISHPVQGTIRMEIEYYLDDDCPDKEPLIHKREFTAE